MTLTNWIALSVIVPIAIAMAVLLVAAFAGVLRANAPRRGRCNGCRCDDVNLGWCRTPQRWTLDGELHCRDCCADPDDWKGA